MSLNNEVDVKIFWKRFFAFLIDAAIMILVMGLYLIPIFFAGTQSSAGIIGSIVLVLMLVTAFAYDAVLTKVKGGTLGKMALKIKVVDLGMNPLSWGRSIGRTLARAFHMLVFNILGQAIVGGKMLETYQLIQDPLQLASHGAGALFMKMLLLWILSVIILYAGYYFAFFTKNRQTLHDLMAGTLVIRKNQGIL